jgi:DNA polymerase III delta subunit
LALANGREVSEANVNELAPQNKEVDVFDLTNAIADNQKQKALSLMQDFLFYQSDSDEKTAIIKLNALLSEQFRSVAIVQSFTNEKTSEDIILEKTGWKSGRLFIMKKVAARFNQKIVLDLLNKLAALDEELKTSSTPPRVLLDLIVTQLFV